MSAIAAERQAAEARVADLRRRRAEQAADARAVEPAPEGEPNDDRAAAPATCSEEITSTSFPADSEGA